LAEEYAQETVFVGVSNNDSVAAGRDYVAQFDVPYAMAHAPHVWEAYDVPFDAEFLEVLNYIPPSSVVCRRPSDGARFDPTLRVEEDWDMWLRLMREHSFRIVHEPQPGVLYHRVTDVGSVTSAVDDIPINQLFAKNYHRITERWPVAVGSRAARYRGWMDRVYEVLFAQLHQNRSPGLNWFERVLRVLLAGFNGEIDDNTVDKGIRKAIGS
jgi:hypothetical protein